MFTLYTVLLTVHIVLVVLWVGAGSAQAVIGQRALKGGPAGREFYAEQLEWFGTKWFPAVSGLAALFGVLLWIDGPWELGEVWILIAVVGWIVSSVIGATQLGPAVQAWREGGARVDDPAWAKLQRFVRIDQVLLMLIIADMVIKPG